MSLPGGVTTITVTGTNLCDLQGNPAPSGTVYFTASGQLVDSTNSVVIADFKASSPVLNGVMTTILLPVNDETVNPNGFTVQVRQELFFGGSTTPTISVYTIALPHTLGSTVDLAVLAPAAPFTPISGVTVTNAGTSGEVLTSTGNYTASFQTPETTTPAWEFHVGDYGAKGDNTTDDTASINAAMAAGTAYALANNGYFELVFEPLTYLIAGAVTTGGSTLGSAQIPLPVQPQTAEKLIIVIRGTYDQSALYHWLQTTPQRAGTVLRSTGNGGNTIPTTGEQSVIGGPTPHFLGDPPSSWNNILVVVQGITIELANPANFCGFDFRDCAEANVPNAAVFGSRTGTGAPAVPAANWGFGLAMPVANNNDNCNIGYYSCEGLVYGLLIYEHVRADSIRIINCFDGLVCWSSSGFPHRNNISYASIEGCQRCIVFAGGFNKLDIDLCDIEWGGSYIVDDVGSITAVGRISLASNGDSGATLSAALNTSPTNVNVLSGPLTLEITNLDQPLGSVTPPAIPGSTVALTNPFWRRAEVHVSGGTVTQVAIDGVSQLSTSGSFTIPPGHTITLTYSAAPSWAWTLVA